MFEKYIQGLTIVIIGILTILSLCCFAVAGWLYIRTEQTPPVVDRLMYVGSILGAVGGGVLVAYSVWEL